MKKHFALTVVVVATTAIPHSIFADDEKAESPAKLKTLVESYERAKARAMDPLDRKFDSALLDLKRQFTREGRLEDALAVNAIIESRSDAPAQKSSRANTRWKWGSGGILELKRNGDATHPDWTRPGEWEELDDGTLKLVSQHGESKVEFFDETSGKVTSAKGGSTTLTLIE